MLGRGVAPLSALRLTEPHSVPTTALAGLTAVALFGNSGGMYRIIGADGREYGPVSAAQLRQWVLENRANAGTSVLLDGTSDWRPLHSIPEFALLFAHPPLSPSTPATQRTNPLATAGLVMGIISVTVGLCCCHGFPFNLLGLIFSLIGLNQIRSNRALYDGEGVALAGLVLSIIGLLLGFGMLLMFGAMSIFQNRPHVWHRW